MKTLIQLITILGHYERGFEEFELSLAVDPKHRRLWQFITNTKGKYTDSDKDREMAFEEVFGKNTPFNAVRIRDLIKDHSYYLEEFTSLLALRFSALGQLQLANDYKKQGKHEQAEIAYNYSLELAKLENPSTRYFIHLEVHKARHFEGITGNLAPGKQQLDLFTASNKLKFFIEELTICRGKDKPIPAESLQDIARTLAQLPHSKPPQTTVEAKAVEYFVNPCQKLFYTFEAAYFENFEEIYDKEFLLISLENAIILCPDSDEKLNDEQAVLYRFGVEKKLFEKVSVGRFCNIIYTANLLQDFNLIELAKEELLSMIVNEMDRYRCGLLAEAYISYGKGEFKEALGLIKKLEKTNSPNPEIGIRKQTLKLKCLYESALHINDARDSIKGQRLTVRNMLDRFLAAEKINNDQKICVENFYRLLCNILINKKQTKSDLLAKLASYGEEMMETKWLKEKIAERLLWDYLYKFKEVYDKTWNKYDALETIQEKEMGFRKMLSRYRKKGYIDNKRYKSMLNFYKILVRICDQRNPLNARRRLLKQLESYGEYMFERTWIEKKIKKLRS